LKNQKNYSVKVTFTDGWEERIAKAAYNLYNNIENRQSQELKKENLQSA
jgi:hypothetical protein